MPEDIKRAICIGEAIVELARGADGRFALASSGDTFNAAIYLRTRPDILPDRIGVIGFSHGGTTTLWAAIGEAVPTSRGGRPFQAAVAYYPGCSGGTMVTPFATDMLILIGKDDDWTLADLCQKTVESRARQSHPPAIKVYRGAVHDFDRGGVPRPYLGHMIGGGPAMPRACWP